MTLLIKICGLQEERHVLAALDAGADALGFVFAESPREVSPATANLICAQVPAQVKRVAVMLHPSQAAWQEVLDVFQPDILQTDASDFAHLRVPSFVVHWPVFREGADEPDTTAPFVYEGAHSGFGDTVDWSDAALLAQDGHMILAGGLNANNVAAAIQTVTPMGVDVSSGVESARGQKNTDRIKAFIRAARAAENNR